MKTIAIVNQKGGVTKTTTAVTLAHGLAMSGYGTILVDLDTQGNCAVALGLPKAPGLYHLLVTGDPDRAIVPTGRPNLDLIPGDKTTVEAKYILNGRTYREQAIRLALEPLADRYDVAILDTAPSVDILQIAALVACDHYLIPVILDHLAVAGAVDVLASIAGLQRVQALHGQLLGILPALWERVTCESHEQLKSLAQNFGHAVWAPIPTDVNARCAPAHGRTLWEFDPTTRAIAGVVLKSDPQPRGGYRDTLERLWEVLP